MKSIKRFLMLGVLAAMTAFCLAPGFALADEGGEKPLSFTDGVCKITEDGTYYLVDDTTGYVSVDGTSAKNVTINLNGHTLTNNADQYAMYFKLVNKVTINAGESQDGEKVGTIVQNCSKGAIRFDSNFTNANLTLNDVKVTAEADQCLQLINGKCELSNVDMSTNGGDSLIYLDKPDVATYLAINSGKFAASGSTELFKIKKGSSVTLKGGSFNKLPEGYATKSDCEVVPPSIGEGFAMFKAKDSSNYVVESESVVKAKSAAKVVLDDCRTVYFNSSEEAETCAAGVTDAKLVKFVKADIKAPENCVYNKKAKQAQVSLDGVDDGADVKADVEYTKDRVSGVEVKDAGSYSAKVKGLIGNDATGYELVDNPSVNFEITKAKANIQVEDLGEKTVGDPAFNLKATADTDATLKYGSSDESVATVDENGQVIILTAGTTTLTVSVDSTDNYDKSEFSVVLTVKAAPEPAPTPEPTPTPDPDPAPVSINISAAKVMLSSTAFTYNGKAQKPSVKSVVLNGKSLVAGTDYTASIASGKKVGTYNVTIAGKGSYTGKITSSFVINPKGVTKLKVSKAKKSFKAKWAKSKVERSGVQLKYSTKKSIANAKTVKAKGASAKAKTVKKLKKKTKYYVQARTYKVVNGKTYYSGWSKVKTVKTK
ncbi:MAG: hypothetical protein Q4A43_05685 [Coriobacteriia bacterium]|nr:hypothetical protein [Coriobacteriia bacterium]